MQELKKELRGALKEIKPKIRDHLFEILDSEDKGAVSEAEYMNVMRPWASFSATDINNDNELDADELKTLIWLVDEVEPSEVRVQRDLKLIDSDGSGTIDRLEYIAYLATPDHGSGKEKLDFGLKEKFDFFDADKDGSLNFDELLELIKEEFEEELKGRSEEQLLIIMKVINSLTREIMIELDVRKDKSINVSKPNIDILYTVVRV